MLPELSAKRQRGQVRENWIQSGVTPTTLSILKYHQQMSWNVIGLWNTVQSCFHSVILVTAHMTSLGWNIHSVCYQGICCVTFVTELTTPTVSGLRWPRSPRTAGSARDVGGALTATARPRAPARAPGGTTTTPCATPATSSGTRSVKILIRICLYQA